MKAKKLVKTNFTQINSILSIPYIESYKWKLSFHLTLISWIQNSNNDLFWNDPFGTYCYIYKLTIFYRGSTCLTSLTGFEDEKVNNAIFHKHHQVKKMIKTNKKATRFRYLTQENEILRITLKELKIMRTHICSCVLTYFFICFRIISS